MLPIYVSLSVLITDHFVVECSDITYTWRNLCILAAYWSCIFTIFLHFILWFSTYFSLYVLATLRNCSLLYQSVQMENALIFLFYISYKYPFYYSFSIDRSTVNNPQMMRSPDI
jgi:hypothetical protein